MSENIIYVTGFPRSGTGFASKYLCSLGFDAAHEHVANDAIVDWRLLPKVVTMSRCMDKQKPLRPYITVVQFRDPVETFNSAFTLMPESLQYIDMTIKSLLPSKYKFSPVNTSNKHEKMALRMICWYTLSLELKYTEKDNLIYAHVDDFSNKKLIMNLSEFVYITPDYKNEFSNTRYNSRNNRKTHGNFVKEQLFSGKIIDIEIAKALFKTYEELDKRRIFRK